LTVTEVATHYGYLRHNLEEDRPRVVEALFATR
jgi:hypothetical protein